MLSAYRRNGIDWKNPPISPVYAVMRSNNLVAIKAILQHMRAKDVPYKYVPSLEMLLVFENPPYIA